MNRLNYIIDQIDDSLSAFYFDGIKFHGLCEQVEKDGQAIPVKYKGYGDYEPVFNDFFGLNVYHRLVDVNSQRDSEQGRGSQALKTEVYSIRLVAFGNQREVNDGNIDINHKIADEFTALLPTKLSKVQLTNIDALNGFIADTGVNTDKREVWGGEFPDMDSKVRPESVLFSIDYEIRLKYFEGCKDLSCDEATPLVDLRSLSCENINHADFGITQKIFDNCGLSSFCPAIPSLTADFSADDTTPEVGQTIDFTNNSTGSPTSYLWDFGDGRGSTDENARHEYLVSGTYTVTLIIYKNGAIGDIATTEITVSNPSSFNDLTVWFIAKYSAVFRGGIDLIAHITTLAPVVYDINTNHAPGLLQASNALKASYKSDAINGYPSIDVDGASYSPYGDTTFLNFTGNDSKITLFFVIKVNSVSTNDANPTKNEILLKEKGGSARTGITFRNDGNDVYVQKFEYDGSNHYTIEDIITVGEFFVLTVERHSTPYQSLQVNDNTKQEDTSHWEVLVRSLSFFSQNGFQAMDGELAELVCWVDDRTEQEIQDQKDKLYNRYGITA